MVRDFERGGQREVGWVVERFPRRGIFVEIGSVGFACSHENIESWG